MTVFGPPNGHPSPETIANVKSRANSRLIAAAPEMLELLKHIPHNNMTATHKMIGTVARCPGCAAKSLLARINGAP